MSRTLSHLYPLPRLGAEAIPLYRGPFDKDGSAYQGTIRLALRPIPRVWAEGSRETGISLAELHARLTDTEVIGWVDRPTVTLPESTTVPDPPETTDDAPRRAGAITAGPFLPVPLTIKEPATMSEVTFFLLNGWRATDGLNTCHQGTPQPGGLQVNLGDWELRLDPRGDLPSKIVRDHTRTTGQHTITHIGRLRRCDAAEFDGRTVLDLIETLEDLISFALGRVISAVLPVGWSNGAAVWAHWGATRPVDLPLEAVSWLDEDRPIAQLTTLLTSGFLAYRTPLKRSVFKNALSYYLTANFDSPETMSTLLPVSGLQVIAYGHFVQTLPPNDPAHVSNAAWQDRHAQRMLRDLLSLTNADLTVPPHLTHLAAAHAAAQKQAHQNEPPPPDPLGVIIKMRNSIAHPTEKSLGRWTHLHWTEAGFYTMHLFDLALLWWLGYDGTYSPRIDARQPHAVPWVGTTTS